MADQLDLRTQEGKAAYKYLATKMSTEELVKLYDALVAEHEDDHRSDSARGEAGQKSAIVNDELYMRELREKFLGSGAPVTRTPSSMRKVSAASIPAKGMSDEERNAYRISVSSRSVSELTTIFNTLSADTRKDLSPQDRKVTEQKIALVNAAITVRKSGGFQG